MCPPSMATELQAEQPRKLRRTTNACVACRQSKIKCSGSEPCANCQRRAVKCRFVDGGNKVVVTERYLHDLQRQARRYEQQRQHQNQNGDDDDGDDDDDRPISPGTTRYADVAFPPAMEVERARSEAIGSQQAESSSYQAIDHGRSIWTSPFTLPSRTIKNTYKNKRNWIWLAPTSLWSFTVRLSLMMTEKLRLESPYTVPNSLDQELYPLHWIPSPVEEPPDISGLPSVDHALYLFNTVKFHLDHNYRFFDEETFLGNIHEFYYGNAVKKATECRLWFVHFLLVLAFGNAFLLQSRNSKSPPGSKFFVRAMSLMPDHASLWKDSLLAIEVLALAGLYFYAIDHRESAHVYVGQAIRIAHLDGLHTELPEAELGVATVTRCRNLWWTLYVMDRHFSSSVGLPMTTQDSDITTPLDPPSACSQQDVTLSLQVKLSQLLSTILTSIYRTEKTQLGTFLEKTGSILQTMAGHAQDIERIIHLKFQNSVDTMPKGIRHITLLYHQCVIVATRPLLLSVLKERLEKLGRGEEDWENFLAPTKSLISTGIKSAAKTLQILTDEDSLLEVFLPFDLEFTYAAAIHLTMANTLFPHEAECLTYSDQARSIIDEMIYKGNRLAASRKTELAHLEKLFGELAARIERRGLQTLTLSNQEQNDLSQHGTEEGPNDQQQQQQQHERTRGTTMTSTSAADAAALGLSAPADANRSPSELSQIPSNLEFLDNIGISSYEFLSLVDQIGNPEAPSVWDFGQTRREGM